MSGQRRTPQSRVVTLAQAVLLVYAGLLAGSAWAGAGFTTEFALERCTFAAKGGNQYFSIRPGEWRLLEGEDDGETVVLEITVLDEKQSITFHTASGERVTLRARVVQEREWVDGELVEVSRNFFARCKETGDIYYFGEDVDIYQGGVALDTAVHVKMGLVLTVPAGVFTSCVKVREGSALEPGAKSIKRYCAGIGLVSDDDLELVDFELASAADDDD